MAERSSKAIEREERYVKKLEMLARISEAQTPTKKAETEYMESASAGIDPSLGGDYSSDAAAVFTNGFTIPSDIQPATINGTSIKLPAQYSTNRSAYFKKRIEHGRESGWKGLQAVDTEKFYFVESVGGATATQNQFAPDFVPILYMLHDAWKQVKPNSGKIQINSGFRYAPATNGKGTSWSGHMCGLAVDIGFSPRWSMDRYDFADMAWGLGLRGIAIDESYIHIDCGPHYGAGWSYGNIPTYNGPGGKRV